MTTTLKEAQASCNLDRGETETRCVEASEEQRRLAQAVHETWSDRAPQVIADRDARRDARLLASTIPASAVRALAEELERCGRQAEYNAGAPAYDHARRRLIDLLPKTEEKTDG